MSYYLVDFENVKKDGLDGIHKLGKEDRVCIFYSKNADSITFDQHRRIIESQAAIEFCKVEVGSKNALDFQLATQLGYLIANRSADQYFIVSKDKGFEILSGYWKNRDVNVTLIADITGRSHNQEFEETRAKLRELLKEEEDVDVDDIHKIMQQYKTKQGISNALMKKYPSKDNKKSSKIYKTIKPLLADKKGS
ncbi:NYN domain-containing protein [bacterium 0.1xD8-71]|nr:NYN domain-containing protein [bacterium 0.1xD8-71]